MEQQYSFNQNKLLFADSLYIFGLENNNRLIILNVFIARYCDLDTKLDRVSVI